MYRNEYAKYSPIVIMYTIYTTEVLYIYTLDSGILVAKLKPTIWIDGCHIDCLHLLFKHLKNNDNFHHKEYIYLIWI